MDEMNETLMKACRRRVHCRTCRCDRDQRALVGWPDKCPEGFTVDNLPEVIGQKPKVFPAQRQALCDKCEERPGCALWRGKPCRGQRLLARPAMSCPDTPPRWGPQ